MACLARPFGLLGALGVPWVRFHSFVVGALTYVLASLVLIAVGLVTSARRLMNSEDWGHTRTAAKR